MKKRIQIKGSVTSLISAIIGIIIFTLIQETYFIFKFGWEEGLFSLIFFVGLALVIVPSLLAGLFLSTILYEDFLQNRLSISMAALKGGALGLIISLGLCALVFVLINGRATFSIFLTYTFEAIVLAVLCGVYAGRIIAMNILNMSSNVSVN